MGAARDELGDEGDGLTREVMMHTRPDIDTAYPLKTLGGYPQGLVGEAIPLSARLMALADVYDALISRRVYKEGMPHQQAAEIIAQGRGSHFDPDVVDAFFQIEQTFVAIAQRYLDSDQDLKAKAAQQ